MVSAGVGEPGAVAVVMVAAVSGAGVVGVVDAAGVVGAVVGGTVPGATHTRSEVPVHGTLTTCPAGHAVQ